MDVPAYPFAYLLAGLCLLAAVFTAFAVHVCISRRRARNGGNEKDPRGVRVITVLNWPEQAPPPYSPLPTHRSDSESSADSQQLTACHAP